MNQLTASERLVQLTAMRRLDIKHLALYRYKKIDNRGVDTAEPLMSYPEAMSCHTDALIRAVLDYERHLGAFGRSIRGVENDGAELGTMIVSDESVPMVLPSSPQPVATSVTFPGASPSMSNFTPPAPFTFPPAPQGPAAPQVPSFATPPAPAGPPAPMMPAMPQPVAMSPSIAPLPSGFAQPPPQPQMPAPVQAPAPSTEPKKRRRSAGDVVAPPPSVSAPLPGQMAFPSAPPPFSPSMPQPPQMNTPPQPTYSPPAPPPFQAATPPAPVAPAPVTTPPAQSAPDPRIDMIGRMVEEQGKKIDQIIQFVQAIGNGTSDGLKSLQRACDILTIGQHTLFLRLGANSDLFAGRDMAPANRANAESFYNAVKTPDEWKGLLASQLPPPK